MAGGSVLQARVVKTDEIRAEAPGQDDISVTLLHWTSLIDDSTGSIVFLLSNKEEDLYEIQAQRLLRQQDVTAVYLR